MSEEFLKECVTEVDIEETAAAIQQANFLTKNDVPKTYENRLSELKKKQTQTWYHYTNTAAKRIATIIVAIITIGALTIGAVEAIRYIRNFYLREHAKYSDVIQTPTVESKETIEIAYGLTSVPEGYELQTNDVTEHFVTQIYVNGGDMIWFAQYPEADLSQSGQNQQAINTEGATINEPVYFGDYEGQYIVIQQGNRLMWSQDGYQFWVRSANLSKEKLIELAKSVKPQE